MPLSQKEIEKMSDIISTVMAGEFQLDEKQHDLLAKVTVGDLIIHCGLNINQTSDFFNQLEIYERKRKNFGFHYTKDSALKESKKSAVNIRKIRKLIKEECECQGLSMHIADPYQPTKNQHGGLDFEDHGVGEQAGMIRSNLHSIFTKANDMYEMIGENDSLPEWLQEKIAVADHMIGSAYDYLSHEYADHEIHESVHKQNIHKKIFTSLNEVSENSKFSKKKMEELKDTAWEKVKSRISYPDEVRSVRVAYNKSLEPEFEDQVVMRVHVKDRSNRNPVYDVVINLSSGKAEGTTLVK
jgi:hypothetical protein